jgi:hypothetical protein
MKYDQKKFMLLALVLGWTMFIGADGFAQTETGLQGTWVNEQGTRKADFYNEAGAWFGKLIWVADDAKVKAGDTLFKDLTWNGKQFIGKAVTPRGVVTCTLVFVGTDKIKITGSKGGMSKAVFWTRTK